MCLIVCLKQFQGKMSLVNIRDVLTSFSPALDYLALSTGDGRIKVSSLFFFYGFFGLIFLGRVSIYRYFLFKGKIFGFLTNVFSFDFL